MNSLLWLQKSWVTQSLVFPPQHPCSYTCVRYRRFFFIIVQGGLTAPVACCLHTVHTLRAQRALRASCAGAGVGEKAPIMCLYMCKCACACVYVLRVGGVYMVNECSGGCWLTEGTRQGRQMVTFWSKLPWTIWLSLLTRALLSRLSACTHTSKIRQNGVIWLLVCLAITLEAACLYISQWNSPMSACLNKVQAVK